ncbi:MAG: PucR family transcriptional regulator ligand-binding domain-containing protein, partial [Actinomycetota bacterium]
MATPAAPTVADLLAAPGLRLHRVVGDAATCQRPVRWVHTTELPDPAAYLRGGELVCTVGVNLTGPDACRGFAAAVAGAGAVAVCFGVGDVHPAVPQALVEACATLALPLLELPAGAPFLAVGEHLADRWSALGEAELLREDHVVEALLVAAAAGSTEQALVDLAAELTGGRLTLSPGPPSRVRWTAPEAQTGATTTGAPSATLLTHLARVL